MSYTLPQSSIPMLYQQMLLINVTKTLSRPTLGFTQNQKQNHPRTDQPENRSSCLVDTRPHVTREIAINSPKVTHIDLRSTKLHKVDMQLRATLSIFWQLSTILGNFGKLCVHFVQHTGTFGSFSPTFGNFEQFHIIFDIFRELFIYFG